MFFNELALDGIPRKPINAFRAIVPAITDYFLSFHYQTEAGLAAGTRRPGFRQAHLQRVDDHRCIQFRAFLAGVHSFVGEQGRCRFLSQRVVAGGYQFIQIEQRNGFRFRHSSEN